MRLQPVHKLELKLCNLRCKSFWRRQCYKFRSQKELQSRTKRSSSGIEVTMDSQPIEISSSCPTDSMPRSQSISVPTKLNINGNCTIHSFERNGIVVGAGSYGQVYKVRCERCSGVLSFLSI